MLYLGCPTDYSILGPLEPVGTARVLQANFDAFKFPTSELVQFRALVTPCIPHCEPVTCHLTGHRPGPDTFTSYGKRRRREVEEGEREEEGEEEEGVVVASAMHIVDHFPFRGQDELANAEAAAAAACSLGNRFPVSVAWIALLACQAVLLVAFVAVCIRRRRWYNDSSGGGGGNCVCQGGMRDELSGGASSSSDTASIYMTETSSGRSKWTFHLQHQDQ